MSVRECFRVFLVKSDDCEHAPEKLEELVAVYDPESGVRLTDAQVHSMRSQQQAASPGGGQAAAGGGGDACLAIVCDDHFVFRQPRSVRQTAVHQVCAVHALTNGGDAIESDE